MTNPPDNSPRRHSIPEAAEIIGDPRSRAEEEARNGLRQFDHGIAIIEQAIQSGTSFRWRPSLIQALHRDALHGLSEFAGNWRPAGVSIAGSRHHPVAASLVPERVEELCDYLNDHMSDKSAIHLSAYTMWRLNWIHPFSDGNGRTSRIFSYVVLSVRLGYILPGTKTIPDQIVANRQPYFDALESADRAWESGTVDVSQMETLLERLLLNQLSSGLDNLRRSGPPDPLARDLSEPLDPRPAAFDFRVVDGIIDVAKENAVSIDESTTDDLASESRRKAIGFSERIEKTNASPILKEDVKRFISRLEGTLRPGLVLSSLRSLESYREFFESDVGRVEITTDNYLMLDDLCRTVRDLAATFPKSREIEAEAVSLSIPLDRDSLEQVLSLTTDLVSQIMTSDAATDEAKDALGETSVSIDSVRPLAEQSKQIAYHILDIDNFIRAGVRYLREGERLPLERYAM